ncbi:MAG: helix-turn-helix domain-containing protein [Chitinophagales bacterium]|nr:helix-turn-helix domain-containing protein [Chitinophagales bacterium]
METLKYKVIKSKTQYNAYCKALETLLESGVKSKAAKDEVDLLTLLIETWDQAHNNFDDLDPVQLLISLMAERNMKANALADKLGVSKGLISDILNYKKGISKEIIRGLSNLFAVSHEAFNRHYDLEHVEPKRKRELVYA